MQFSIFSRKKRPFNVNDFYADWYKTLTKDYMPLLRQMLNSAAGASESDLSNIVNSILGHIVFYYETLELCADHSTIYNLLSSSSRNSHQTPFLFLGEIHPCLLTSLLRSFTNPQIQDSGHVSIELDRPLGIVNAWQEEPSDQMETTISMIECRTRMNVPALLERMRIAQRGHVARVSENWISSHNSQDKRKKKTMVDDGLTKEEMDTLLEIFLDANQLRKTVINSIVKTLSLYQKALYLEGLCKNFVGLNDQVYKDREKDSHSKIDSGKRDNKVLLTNFVNGVISVPSFFLLMGNMTNTEIKTTGLNFGARMIGAATTTFLSAMFKRRGLSGSTKDALWGFSCFFLGGIIPILFGVLISSKIQKILVTIALTGVLIGFVVV